MLDTLRAAVEPGVASLVGGIVDDAQKLVRQEIALAKREVAEGFTKVKSAAALLIAALPFVAIGGILLGFMLVKILHQYLMPNHEWACFAIVGFVFALVGGGLIYCGLGQIKRIKLALPQTAETLREDVHAVSDAVSGDRSSTNGILNR